MTATKFIAAIPLFLYMQAFAQQSVVAAGGDASSSQGKIAYTIGQVSYRTVSGNGGSVSEGVQQTDVKATIPQQPLDLVISNYVSPNNDNKNDTWRVEPFDKIAAFEVLITDQWGGMVFRKDHDYQSEWNGTHNGKTLPDGVYYYSFLKEGKVVYAGSITLLRNP